VSFFDQVAWGNPLKRSFRSASIVKRFHVASDKDHPDSNLPLDFIVDTSFRVPEPSARYFWIRDPSVPTDSNNPSCSHEHRIHKRKEKGLVSCLRHIDPCGLFNPS